MISSIVASCPCSLLLAQQTESTTAFGRFFFTHSPAPSPQWPGNPAASCYGLHVAELVHRLKPNLVVYIIGLLPQDPGGPLGGEQAACTACLCRLGPKRATPSVPALILGKRLNAYQNYRNYPQVLRSSTTLTSELNIVAHMAS